jgi:hypothetical protein
VFVTIILIAIAGGLGILARWLKSLGVGLFAITYVVFAFVVPNVR